MVVLAKDSGKSPSFAVVKRPLLGPETQDKTPPKEPNATQKASTYKAHFMFTDSSIMVRACIKPDSIWSLEFGTTAAMASEPKVNSTNTMIDEIKIAAGYCFLGLSISAA